jgi:hypothetical protein
VLGFLFLPAPQTTQSNFDHQEGRFLLGHKTLE